MSLVVHAPLPSSLDPSATRSSTTSTTNEHEIIHAPLPSRNSTSPDPPDSYSNVIDDDDQYSTESAIVRGEYGEDDPPINSSEISSNLGTGKETDDKSQTHDELMSHDKSTTYDVIIDPVVVTPDVKTPDAKTSSPVSTNNDDDNSAEHEDIEVLSTPIVKKIIKPLGSAPTKTNLTIQKLTPNDLSIRRCRSENGKSQCEYFDEESCLEDGDLPALQIQYKTIPVTLNTPSPPDDSEKLKQIIKELEREKTRNRLNDKRKNDNNDKDSNESSNLRDDRQLSPNSKRRHRAFFGQLETEPDLPDDEQSYYSSHSKTKSTVKTDDEESDEDEGGGFFNAILDMCADCGFTGGDNETTKKEKSQYSTRSRTQSHNKTRNLRSVPVRSNTHDDDDDDDTYEEDDNTIDDDDDDDDEKMIKKDSNQASNNSEPRNETVVKKTRKLLGKSATESTTVEVEYIPETTLSETKGGSFIKQSKSWSAPDTKNAYVLSLARKAKTRFHKSKGIGFDEVMSGDARNDMEETRTVGTANSRSINGTSKQDDHEELDSILGTIADSPSTVSDSYSTNRTPKKLGKSSTAVDWDEQIYQDWTITERREFLKLLDKNTPLDKAQNIIVEKQAEFKNSSSIRSQENIQDSKNGPVVKFSLSHSTDDSVNLESNNNKKKNVTSPSNSNLQPHTARSVSFEDNESDKHNENRSDEMKMGSKLGSSIKGNLRKRNKTNDLKKIEENDDNFDTKNKNTFKTVKEKSVLGKLGDNIKKVTVPTKKYEQMLDDGSTNYDSSPNSFVRSGKPEFDDEETVQGGNLEKDYQRRRKTKAIVVPFTTPPTTPPTTLNPYDDSCDVSVITGTHHGNDGMSVSSRSVYTSSTNASNWSVSTRRRHRGAAQNRAHSHNDKKENGWVDSIKKAAEANNRVWDSKEGWVGYEEPDTPEIDKQNDISRIGSLKSIALSKPSTNIKSKEEPYTNKNENSNEDEDSRSEVPFPSNWEKERQAMLGSVNLRKHENHVTESEATEVHENLKKNLDAELDKVLLEKLHEVTEEDSEEGEQKLIVSAIKSDQILGSEDGETMRKNSEKSESSRNRKIESSSTYGNSENQYRKGDPFLPHDVNQFPTDLDMNGVGEKSWKRDKNEMNEQFRPVLAEELSTDGSAPVRPPQLDFENSDENMLAVTSPFLKIRKDLGNFTVPEEEKTKTREPIVNSFLGANPMSSPDYDTESSSRDLRNIDLAEEDEDFPDISFGGSNYTEEDNPEDDGFQITAQSGISEKNAENETDDEDSVSKNDDTEGSVTEDFTLKSSYSPLTFPSQHPPPPPPPPPPLSSQNEINLHDEEEDNVTNFSIGLNSISSQSMFSKAKKWVEIVETRKKNKVKDNENRFVDLRSTSENKPSSQQLLPLTLREHPLIKSKAKKPVFVSAVDDDSAIQFEESKVSTDDDTLFDLDDSNTLFNFEETGKNNGTGEGITKQRNTNLDTVSEVLTNGQRKSNFFSIMQSSNEEEINNKKSDAFSEVLTNDPRQSNFFTRMQSCTGTAISRQKNASIQKEKDYVRSDSPDLPLAHLAFLRKTQDTSSSHGTSSSRFQELQTLAREHMSCNIPSCTQENIQKKSTKGIQPKDRSMRQSQTSSVQQSMSTKETFQEPSERPNVAARTRYLDTLATQNTIGSKPTSDSGTEKSEAWQRFLQKRNTTDDAPEKSGSDEDASKAAENYASAKVQAIMDQIHTRSSSRAEELATKRVEAIMTGMSNNNMRQ